MSSLFASLRLDGLPTDPALLARLTRTMDTEGPDGRHTAVSGPAGLGITWSAVLPLQDEEACRLEHGPLLVGFDGRLDDRRALRQRLGPKAPPEDAHDAALVAAAYRVYGPDLCDRLLGDWAFVLWDPAARRLVAARDVTGRRGLQWWCDGRTLLLASWFAPILEHPDVRVRPDEAAVADWLTGEPYLQDRTLYDGVRLLRAGRVLTAMPGSRPVLRRYWRPENEFSRPYRTLADATDAAREALTAAVTDRLRGAGRPVVHVSGGWDSSTVAILAADDAAAHGRAAPRFVTTDASAFPDADELEYVAAVGRRLGEPVELMPFIVADPGEDAALIADLRYPTARDPFERFVATADAHGCLTGQWGDEFLGGTTPSLARFLRPGNLMALRRRYYGLRNLGRFYLEPAVAPWYPLDLRARRHPAPGPWLHPRLLASFDVQRAQAAAAERTRGGTLRQLGLIELLDAWKMHQDRLTNPPQGRYVEALDPFVDRRVVAAALRTPARLSGTWDADPRRLHRAAFGARLPPEVATRTTKAEFTAYYAASARERMRSVAGLPQLVARGWVDREAGDELLGRHHEGRYREAAERVYLLETWCRVCLD